MPPSLDPPSMEDTQRLASLLEVAREERDDLWAESFLDALWNAALTTTDDQVMEGPDGFPYFLLQMPRAEEPFQGLSMKLILEHVTDQGVGIVVNPAEGEPDWVFTFGDLWSRREFGTFFVDTGKAGEAAGPKGDGADREDAAANLEGEASDDDGEIMLSAPSDAYLPPYVRRAIADFLESTGVEKPRVTLATEADSARQSLIFSVFQEDFEDREEFAGVMNRLGWFLPRHYNLAAVSRDSELAEVMEPLRS